MRGLSLNWMLTEGLTEKVMFEQNPEGREAVSQKLPEGWVFPAEEKATAKVLRWKGAWLEWERIAQSIKVIRY